MNRGATPASGTRWLLPAGIAVLATFLQLSGQIESLRLERGLALVEPWRLVTGHLIHLGWAHLFMNLAGLAVIWALLAPAMGMRLWALTMILCGAGVTSGLLLFSAHVAWYAGFSGILHGLLAAGAVAGLRRMPGICAALLALLVFKLAVEQLGGTDPGTVRLIGHAVIVDAHLYGATAGLTFGIIELFRRRCSTR